MYVGIENVTFNGIKEGWTQDVYGGNFSLYEILILLENEKSTLLMWTLSIIYLGELLYLPGKIITIYILCNDMTL